MFRDEVRKARAQLELNFVRAAKNNKKGFGRCVNQNRKVEENIHPLNSPKSKSSKLVTVDEKAAEVLKTVFSSVFTSSLSSLLPS